MHRPALVMLVAASSFIADPPAVSIAEPAVASIARLPFDPAHYGPLQQLDGKPRVERADLDRKVFDLGAMRPSYFSRLTLAPTYLKLPVSAFVLPDPPENSSSRTRAELEDLVRLQTSVRTPALIARARVLADVYYRVSVKPDDPEWARMRRNLFAVGTGIGAGFDPDRLPRTAELMARVWSDATYYIWALKFRYNRIRPHHLDSRLEALEDANFPAYPSGHASNSYVAALVFADLLPRHRQLFLDNAAELAFSRELLGVHFASDTTAGRQFAEKLVAALSKAPAYQADLAAARAEIAAAGIGK
jgi:acid phosphatase (class A)